MNKSDTYIVYGEWEYGFEDLTDEELGALTRAFFAYVRRGENPTFSDRMVRSCWRRVQQTEDRALMAYDKKCEQNRKNGKKGGRPKKEDSEKTEKANGFSENPTKPNKTLPNPNPNPNPNLKKNIKKKNKFMNFDERSYTDEEFEEMEKKLGGAK